MLHRLADVALGAQALLEVVPEVVCQATIDVDQQALQCPRFESPTAQLPEVR